MIRHYVNSSRISRVGWLDNTLEVEFRDGAIYQYYNVAYNEYQYFINSASLGRSLSIIDKTHAYRRVV